MRFFLLPICFSVFLPLCGCVDEATYTGTSLVCGDEGSCPDGYICCPETNRCARYCDDDPMDFPPVDIDLLTSMRLMVLNADCPSPVLDAASHSEKAARACGRAIGERLRDMSDDLDVVGLLGVWDETSKEEITKAMGLRLPFRIIRVGGGGSESKEDSGMMLLSRLPFAPLRSEATTLNESSEFIDSNQDAGLIAWQPFGSCNQTDCLAKKGALGVRIEGYGHHVYDFVLTHLQEGDAVSVRASQLASVNSLVLSAFGQEALENAPKEDVFILADLSIDGNTCSPSPEWSDVFETTNKDGFDFITALDGAFYDLWINTTNEKSCGATTRSGERTTHILASFLDFSIHDVGAQIFTSQEMNRVDLGSENLGLTASIDKPEAGCNPAVARTITTKPSGYWWDDLEKPDGGEIENAGSFDWYVLESPGTISLVLADLYFGEKDSQLLASVRRSDDFSFDLRPFGNETIFSSLDIPGTDTTVDYHKTIFHSSDEPLFVRIWSADRYSVMPYSFNVIRHTCTTTEDACVLRSGDPESSPDDALTAVSTAKEFVYRAFLDPVSAGRPQTLDFQITNNTGALLTATLYNEGDDTLNSAVVPASVGSKQSLSYSTSDAEVVRLVLGLDDAAAAPCFFVSYQSDLRYLIGRAAPGAFPLALSADGSGGCDWKGDTVTGQLRISVAGTDVVTWDLDVLDPKDRCRLDDRVAALEAFHGDPIIAAVDPFDIIHCKVPEDEASCTTTRLPSSSTEHTDLAIPLSGDGTSGPYFHYSLARRLHR